MDKIIYLVIHCTATVNGHELTSDDICRMHLGPLHNKDGSFIYKGVHYPNLSSLPNEFIGGISIKSLVGRGWKQVGYTLMFHLDGRRETLVGYDDDEWISSGEITNGATGINSKSRHIVYVGGLDNKMKPKDTRTEAQRLMLEREVLDTIKYHPDIKILGHNQVANKACPCFDVPKWLENIGIDKKNIY